MVLQLKYNEHINLPAAAAFIRGNNPLLWLRTMQGWGAQPEDLTCMILSENNDPHVHAGLFVIFRAGKVPAVDKLMHPYAVVGHKLYIPIHATLFPAMTEEELRAVLIWDYQVFHPTYGFFGFESTDIVKLEDLLRYPAPKQADWGHAAEGDMQAPPLQRINMEAPAADEIFDNEKELINNKDLKDILKDTGKKKNNMPKWLDVIIRPFLKAGFKIIDRIIKSLPVSPTGKANGLGSLIEKMHGWMGHQLDDLEQRRDSELNRLLSLFEKDLNNALHYAIPLSSKYLDRGSAPKGSKLGWRSTIFNSGNLGGGRVADGWEIGDYYGKLRTNYLKAAEAAEKEGDYKKAAYVHAHLLADYQAAAKTLERGKYFREAAALYKEHLKNLPAAAECLEKGGLYLDAIEIYIELERDEKTGDLYALLEQKENADKFYQQCIRRAMTNHDHLEAARLHADKMKDKHTARSLLLDGWKDKKRPAECLHRYFDLTDEAAIPMTVKKIYEQHTHPHKKNEFLKVLSGLVKRYNSDTLTQTTRNIAYEIASNEAAAGNNNSLLLLRDFMEQDKQLVSDCYKFISTQPLQVAPATETEISLVDGVNWFNAVTCKNQILALGHKSSGLYLARCNVKGEVEYYSWNIPVKDTDYFHLIADDRYADQILLLSNHSGLTDIILHSNSSFQWRLQIVANPKWLPEDCLSVAPTEDGFACLYPGEKEMLMVALFKPEGECIKIIDTPLARDPDYKLLYTGGRLLIITNDSFLEWEEQEDQDSWKVHTVGAITYVTGGGFFSQSGIAVFSKWTGGLAWGMHELSKPVVFSKGEEEVSGIEFVADNIIAVIYSKKVLLYDIADKEATTLKSVSTTNAIQELIPGMVRGAFGILDVNGKISQHKI